MSNRLTFSLASLIVLITFGLVFGTTSVMAHDSTKIEPVDNSTPITSHTHPVNEAVTDDPNTDNVTENVPAHNSHPMVTSIMLKPDADDATTEKVRGNMVVIGAAPSGGQTNGVDANEFVLVIDFDQDVVSANKFRNVAADTGSDTALAANEFGGIVLNADDGTIGTGVASGNLTIDAPTRVEDDDSKWEAVVLVDTAATPNGTADDPLETVRVRIRVNENAVFSFATIPGAAEVPGGGSEDSMLYEFTLVNALPATPTAPGAPTGLMADVNHERGTITLNWMAPSDTGGTTATPATITGYTVTKNYSMADGTAAEPVVKMVTDATLTIPGSADPDLPTDTEFTFTVTATNSNDLTGPASDPAMAMIDRTAPTVEIGAPTLASGVLTFPITVSEMLGSGANDLELNDFTIMGADPAVMSELTGPDADNDFTLTVTPGANMSVTVTLTGDVRDPAGNQVDVMTTPITATYDVTPPVLDVAASSIVASTTNTNQLIVTLVYNEDVNPATIDLDDARGNAVSKAGAATAVADSDHTYMVTANAPGHADRAKTYMVVEAGVEDIAENATTADIELTYTSPTLPTPTVAISANPHPLNCDTGSTISFAITGTTEKLALGDITVGAGWVVGADNDPADGSLTIVPDGNNAIGVTTVKVSVAANAVGKNEATDMTFTVGPVIEIPGGSYVLVQHSAHVGTTSQSHLRDPYVLGSIPIRAPEVAIQGWECMPDLTVFFGRSAPAIGGGAIVIKEADGPLGHDPGDTLADIKKGSVGLSEIMWGSDQGIQHGGAFDIDTGRRSRTNYDQTREQWIELHNINSTPVKVTLFARATDQALTTEADELDRVSNYNINNVWDPRGQSGNSATGIDFISMQRGKHDNAGATPPADPGYAHGDWNGIHGNRWTASTFSYLTARADLWQTLPAENQLYDFFGTPGRDNKPSASSPIVRTNVPKNSIVFNEVANRRDQTLEWIELKNVSDGEVNLRKYQISLATAKGTDHVFYNFPDNDNIKLAAGELLLLLDTDPRDNDAHPIAVAFNRDGGNDQALGIGDDAIKYKVANFREGGLPDNGNFVLYLRNGNDKLGQAAKVIDLIGWSDNLADASKHTQVWPLNVFGAPDKRNQIAVETVHRRQHRIDPDKNTHGDDKDEHQALRDAGYTGIGYKRHAQSTAAHGGTPGHEDTRKNLVGDIAATGTLTISEIMYDQGDGEYPQWIEIYNSSETQPVNLHSEAGWRLLVENYDDGEIPVATLSGTLNFKNSDVQTILPQQTVIIASTRARNSGSAFFDTRVVFPATRVFSVWAGKNDQRKELGMTRSTDPILSERGFYLELIDGKGNFADGVGNLVKSPNRRVAATIEWELSDINGGMDNEGRSSILRAYREYKDGKVVGRYTDAQIEDMGVEADGWMAAYMTDFRDVRQTWYGHPDDAGSPGITGGRVLPVELSKFRPERLDSGEIVIRWITQSELNNAGFNILRSEERTGDYKQINTKLIAGQGTTSEKTNYEWKDTSAKPNVVYYYQIQDVSLDGKVATLAQTRLRGHVSPAGKATTTWGELKALQ